MRCRSPQGGPLRRRYAWDGAASAEPASTRPPSRASSCCPRSTPRGRGGGTRRGGRTGGAAAPLEATQDPLKLYVRQIGDGRLLTPPRSASSRAARTRATRRRSEADRVEPPPRDVDHAQLHEGGRAAARPDPGGQPRPDPRGREVRLHAGLQALDVRDLVDPPVGDAGARGAGPHDPAARARRRPGASGHARPPPARAEAEPRPDLRRDRGGDRLHAGAGRRAARARAGPRQPRDRRSATARASTATWSRTRSRPARTSRRPSACARPSSRRRSSG